MNSTPSNQSSKTALNPSASKLAKTTPTRPTFTSSRPLSSAPRSTTPLSSARPVSKPTATTTTARPTTQFATRPQTTINKPTSTATPRATAPRPATKRSLTRNQIYVICGLVAALLLFMAFVIPFVVDETKHNTVFADEYRSTARHGYESEIIGTVKRNIPTQTYDEGLVDSDKIPYYPTYGSTASYTAEQKTAVIKESEALTSCYTMNDVSGIAGHCGAYAYFDKEGYQRTIGGGYVDDAQGNHKKLYAHTASKSMYYQGVKHVPYISDDEPAVIKRITFRPRQNSAYNKGYSVTGLYAAPGELVTVKISGADLKAAGGQIAFFIGQCLYNGQSNNIWAAKGMNRMPNILNTLRVNKDTAEYDEENDIYTAYLGSYLGGPIYLWRHTGTITMVISGALEYRHFVLGYTTEKEYERLSKTTTPYFDLEIWDNGILHSGSVYYAAKYSYDQIFDAAVLWEKITLVSTQVRKQGVVMVYDPFVAAGAAVAFPGRSSTNCPSGWMDGALNAAAFEKSGSWGNMHEYNHNFQGGWELGGGGEVSNNALNLASYLSFTKISSSRRLSTLNSDTGLGGWNAYTNASWALKNTLNKNAWPNQLVVYSTLLHGIGPKNFMSGVAKKGGLYKEMSVATGYNFDYYFEQIIQETVSDDAKTAYADRPAFVPVASIFQTGRSVVTTKGTTEDIQTMQPYEFVYGENLTIDLRQYNPADAQNSGTIVVPNGVSFEITNVTQPEYGTLTETATKGVYTYTPDPKELLSGQIRVSLTLHVTDDSLKNYGIEGQTVDLILEFKQSHEMNRTVLQRTVYKYDTGATDPLKDLYGNDPIAAFTSNFSGSTSVATMDNKNPTENSNTDIWLKDQAEYNQYGANSILVVSGKIYVPEAGSYRLTLRGRVHAGVVLSLDGGATYGGKYQYKDKDGNNVTKDLYLKLENKGGSPDLTGKNAVVESLDLPNLPAGQWVYFKEILLMNEKAGNKLPFIGLGWGKIEPVLKKVEVVDKNGNPLKDDDGNQIYDMVETGETTATLNYASGYRATYEFETKPYTSEYLFKRDWKATYDPSVKYDNRGTLIEVKGFTPWSKKSTDNYGIANLFDDDNTNDIHNMSGAANDITPEHPFEIFVDLGALQDVNTMTIYGRNASYVNYLPRNFTLYGGYSKNNLQVLATHTDGDPDWRVGNNLVVKFHPATIRYYRLVVHDTYIYNEKNVGSRYICFRYIQFDGIEDTLTNGTHLIPDDDAITYRGTWKVVNATSTFGRVYLGKAKDKVEFEFTGTRFGIYTAINQSNGEFDVYIDGKRVAIANPKDGRTIDNYTAMGYLSDTLKAGTHKVKLVGRANFNIDSIVYW